MALLGGCNTARRLRESEHLLVRNRIHVAGRARLHKDLQHFLKQKPNSRFLGLLPLGLQVYNLIDPDYKNAVATWDETLSKTKAQRDSLLRKNQLHKGAFKWNYWLYKLGTPPVRCDSLQTKHSERQLRDYLFTQGYFNAQVHSQVALRGKKARVHYYIEPGERYAISTYHQKIDSPVLDSLYRAYASESPLHSGQPYRRENLSEERDRLDKWYLNHGYYDFDKSYIQFAVDTNGLGHKAKVILRITAPQVERADSALSLDFKPYRFGRVCIFTNYRASDRKATPKDSTRHRGYYLYSFDSTFHYRPRALTDAIGFSPGDRYSSSHIDDTYANLNALQNFNTNIRVQRDSTQAQSLIASVYLTRYPRYQLTAGLEGSFSEYFRFGSGIDFSLLSRNLFGGAENLQFSTKVSLGTVRTGNSRKNHLFNAVEGAVQADLIFPRFLIPFFDSEVKLKGNVNPQTRISTGLSLQNNIGLGKVHFTNILDYHWQQRPLKKYKFELLNIQYIHNKAKDKYYYLFPNDRLIADSLVHTYQRFEPDAVGQLSETVGSRALKDRRFTADPENARLAGEYANMKFRQARITRDFLFASMRYTFTYDQRGDKRFKHPWYLRASVESSGNVLIGLEYLLHIPKNSQGEFAILGVPIAQYAKLNLDIKRLIPLSYRSTLAVHLLMGVAYPYGNSRYTPFNKSYLAGGSYDVRAWQAYELGPGGVQQAGVYAVGDLKLSSSLEYRFPLSKRFEGALFVDAGNIWNVYRSGEGPREVNPQSIFHFNTFYQQLGIGSGLGLRYNFGYFLMRLDVAWRIRDPGKPAGQRWIWQIHSPSGPQFQFGIGYPF